MKKIISLVLIVILVLPAYGFIFKSKSKPITAISLKYKKKNITIYLKEDEIEFIEGDIRLLEKAMSDEKFMKEIGYNETMQLIFLYYITNIMERVNKIEGRLEK